MLLAPALHGPTARATRFHLQRLKDKLGNRSNASSEVEFDGAWARLVGEEGRGVPTIIEMVGHTRLDCVHRLGRRHALRRSAQAIHARRPPQRRSASCSIDQPLMRNVLADLRSSPRPRRRRRCGSRAPTTPTPTTRPSALQAAGHRGRQVLDLQARAAHAAEALECLGGNGYVEESGMPRLYREAPLNWIWEGSGNVIWLDVLRALVKTPASLEALFAEIDEAKGADARLDAYVAETREAFGEPDELEVRARRVVERMALSLQGSLLVRTAPPAVADAFVGSRLGGESGPNLLGLRHPPGGHGLRGDHHRHALAVEIAPKPSALPGRADRTSVRFAVSPLLAVTNSAANALSALSRPS